MAEIDRFGGCGDWINLELMPRERISEQIIKVNFIPIMIGYIFEYKVVP